MGACMLQRTKFGVIAIIVVGVLVALIPLFFKDVRNHFSGSMMQKVGASSSSTTLASSDAKVLGTIDGKAVSKEELSSGEKVKLFEAENAYFNAIEEMLTQRYVSTYFENLQKQKNFSSPIEAQNDFFKSRVNVSDRDVQRLLDENKDNPNLQRMPEAERHSQVRQYLEGNARRNAIRSLVEEAKQKGEINIAMPRPVEPRVEVTDGGNDFVGPKDAKVTIVEFADYQCPFCARMIPTLKEIVKKYDGKVRWVYRDFPLTEIHPNAMPAAIVAECAGEQGKYFEMHNKLFDNYQNLGEDLYKKIAKEIGLNESQFETCRKDDRIAAEVRQDAAEGTQLGVNGTPTYFVNGRKMGGGDINEFSRVIEEELARM